MTSGTPSNQERGFLLRHGSLVAGVLVLLMSSLAITSCSTIEALNGACGGALPRTGPNKDRKWRQLVPAFAKKSHWDDWLLQTDPEEEHGWVSYEDASPAMIEEFEGFYYSEITSRAEERYQMNRDGLRDTLGLNGLLQYPLSLAIIILSLFLIAGRSNYLVGSFGIVTGSACLYRATSLGYFSALGW